MPAHSEKADHRCPPAEGRRPPPAEKPPDTGLPAASRDFPAQGADVLPWFGAWVIGDNAGVMTDALWAGTFHGIGARLLRDYAGEIGLNPAFTIHDREDSADLMNLMRHELGFSKTENRFPAKGTCLAIYSRCVNAGQCLKEIRKTGWRRNRSVKRNGMRCLSTRHSKRPTSMSMSRRTVMTSPFCQAPLRPDPCRRQVWCLGSRRSARA